MLASGSSGSCSACRAGGEEPVKRHAAKAAHEPLAGGGAPADQTPQPAARGLATAGAGAPNSPIIVLSYAYAGAEHVQNALAMSSSWGCTSGTGIIPQCAAAAEAWRRIEGQQGMTMSRLAAAAIRGLVTAQISAILASSGRRRWCELTTAAPGAAETFLQVFPDAHFVCVHRSCLDVIGAGVQANPWGLQGPSLRPFLLAYPGNSVAALAAYWVNSTEQLLGFERANQQATDRVRYEDVTAQPGQALAAVRAALEPGDIPPAQPGWLAEPGEASAEPALTVPAELIPQPLRERITHLHAELGYPPPE